MPLRNPCEELSKYIATSSPTERSRLEKDRPTLELQLKATVDREIQTDLNHLGLVNLCVKPFTIGSDIDSGYLFIRTDPLYSVGCKMFDLVVYGRSSRTAIMIECKTSVPDPEREVEETMEKAKAVDEHLDLLAQNIGDDIERTESVLCVFGGALDPLKKANRKIAVPICLWSGDLFSNQITLHATYDDETKKPWEKGVHADENLTRLLAHTITVASGPVKVLPFMARSHPATMLGHVLSEVCQSLKTSGEEIFGVNDVFVLVNRVLAQHSPDEIEKVVHICLNKAVELNLVRDETPYEQELAKKRFSLDPRSWDAGQVRATYTERSAKSLVCEELLRRFKSSSSRLSGFLDKGTLV
jgi:hypothetical protein